MNALRVLPIVLLAQLLLAQGGSAETVKVGLLLPLSGVYATVGKAMAEGIGLYMAQHQGELGGHRIELVRRDTTGPNPNIAQRLAQELIVRDKVQILAGLAFTPNSIAIAPLVTQAKIPTVIMNAAASVITTKSPYFVRTSLTLWQTEVPLGTWAATEGDRRKIYTMVADYSPGHDAEAAFISGYKAAGGEVIGSIRVPITTLDFAPYLQRVRDSGAKSLFVFLTSGRMTTAFMRTFDESGLKAAGVKLIGSGDITEESELPNMGAIPLGVVTAWHYSAVHDSQVNKDFVAAWRKFVQRDGDPNFIAVGAYDGMAVIFSIVQQLNGAITGDKAMSLLKGWKHESPRGPIMIDAETRDITQNIYLRRVEKVGNRLANVEFKSIPMVKDPWKERHSKP